MRKLQVLFVLTIVTSLFLVSASSAAPKNPTVGIPADTSVPHLVYDPASGNMGMNLVADANPAITTWEMQSAGGKIDCAGLNAGVLAGLFDSCSAEKLFILRPDGQASLDFGAIYPAGTPSADVAADLLIDGSLAGGGSLGANDDAAPYLVPEPSSLALLGLGLLGLMGLRRKS